MNRNDRIFKITNAAGESNDSNTDPKKYILKSMLG